MEVNLLYKYTDEIFQYKKCYQEKLEKDLKLTLLLDYMSRKDNYLYGVCEQILMCPLVNLEEIIWRQEVMKEAIKMPNLFGRIYEIAKETLEKIEAYQEFTAPKYYQIVKNSKKIITEVEMLEILVDQLSSIRDLLAEQQSHFIKEPLRQFRRKLETWFNDDFIASLQVHLKELSAIKEDMTVTLTGNVFLGFKRNDFILNEIKEGSKRIIPKENNSFWNRLFKEKHNSSIKLQGTEMENNAKDLIEANLGEVFKLLSQFNKRMITFFKNIKCQFGFYSCCGQLYKELTTLGVTCSFPEFEEGADYFKIQEMIDIGLAIKQKTNVVGNTLSVEKKNLWIITGANQGGKTTFLRSIGLGVLMAQCGLFVSATFYKTRVFTGIYTHFPNEEDGEMNRGLLEVELDELSQIIEKIDKDSLLLMNESFATTTEAEGSQIAEEVTRALRESGIYTIFVTHLFEYANKLYQSQPEDVIFYQAGRDEGGTRTYRISEGEPIEYGNGIDLYYNN